MIRYHELSPDPPVAMPSGEPPAAPQEGATDSSAGGSESGEPDNVEGEGGATVESSHFANLFDSLTHSLLKVCKGDPSSSLERSLGERGEFEQERRVVGWAKSSTYVQ